MMELVHPVAYDNNYNSSYTYMHKQISFYHRHITKLPSEILVHVNSNGPYRNSWNTNNIHIPLIVLPTPSSCSPLVTPTLSYGKPLQRKGDRFSKEWIQKKSKSNSETESNVLHIGNNKWKWKVIKSLPLLYHKPCKRRGKLRPQGNTASSLILKTVQLQIKNKFMWSNT